MSEIKLRDIVILKNKLEACLARNDIEGARKIYDQINSIYAKMGKGPIDKDITPQERALINRLFKKKGKSGAIKEPEEDIR